LNVDEADMKNLKRGRKLLGGLFVMVALAVPAGAVQQLMLAWDRSPDTSVTGYKIYYRATTSTNLTSMDAGGATSLTLPALTASVTYTFYVTAYNGAGLESDPSNSVDYTIPMTPASLTQNGQTGVLRLSVPAVPGKSVGLQSSTNLVNWAVVASASVGQPLTWLVTNRVSIPKQFYRSVALP
jgi:hypothetical protein